MTKLLIKIDLNTKSLLESCKDSLKIIKIPNSFNLIIENDSLNQCLNLKTLEFYEKVNLGYFNRNEIGWNKDNLPLDFFPISLTSLSLGNGSSFNKPLLLNSLPNGLLVLKFNQDSKFNHPIEVGVLPVTLITLEFGYAFSFKITDPNILPKSLQYLVLPSETSSISKNAIPKSSGGSIEGITYMGGISLQNTYYVANYNSKSSSSEADITNSTDLMSCYSNSIVDETSGQLHLQLGSTSFRYDVKIEEIQLSPSPSIKSSMFEKKLATCVFSCKIV
ncbi:hypothetical protein ACTFIR_008997 [Dictyostelium discoideum]